MARKLHVILKDSEYLEIEQAAHSRQMSVEKWMRQALVSAHGREFLRALEKKLDAIRAAVRHEFPTSDIDTMLAEIGRGYSS